MSAVLDHDQLRLYRLIWQRTVATQMAEARFNQVGVDVEARDGDVPVRPARHRPDARVRRVHPRLQGRARRGSRRGRGVHAPRAHRGAAAADARGPSRAALHAAASSLLRGLAREDAGGARDRPPVHLRVDHLHDPGPRVRAPGGQALLPRGRRHGGDRQADRALPRRGRRELHRPSGGGARRHRRGPDRLDPGPARVQRPVRARAREGRALVRTLRGGAGRDLPALSDRGTRTGHSSR